MRATAIILLAFFLMSLAGCHAARPEVGAVQPGMLSPSTELVFPPETTMKERDSAQAAVQPTDFTLGAGDALGRLVFEAFVAMARARLIPPPA
jgi:hypothetical protein